MEPEAKEKLARREPRGGTAAIAGASVTMRHVALRAGVSTATVSRVFADPGNGGLVSSRTRSRVLRAADELGYRPHRAARLLARQRSELVGVLVPAFGTAFVPEVMDALAVAVHEVGYETMFACYGSNGRGLSRALDYLLEMRVEGIVFYPQTSLPIDDASVITALQQVPYVLVDLAIDGLRAPLVTSDDANGIRQAVDYLVSLGHERIAHLAGVSWHSTGRIRLLAYREAMAEHGLHPSDESVAHYDFTYGDGVVAAHRLLQVKPMPTAVIAADDFGAAALLQVSRQMGLRVPGDMSVVGFSDILLCHTWYPPLTTVRQPKEDLGREAFRLLRQLIEGEHLDVGDAVRLLPTELIVRESCGPVGVKAGRPRKTRRS